MYKINFFVACCYLKEAQERLKIFRNDIRKILYLLQASSKVRYIFPGFDKHFKDNRARLLTLLKSEVKRWRISRLHISSRSPNVKQSRLFSIIVLDRLVPRVFPFFWERRPAHSTAKKKRNRRATREGRVCHVNEHIHEKVLCYSDRGGDERWTFVSNVDEIEFRGADFPRRFPDFYRPISTRGTSRKRNMVIRPTTVDAILAPSARSTLFMSGWTALIPSFIGYIACNIKQRNVL